VEGKSSEQVLFFSYGLCFMERTGPRSALSVMTSAMMSAAHYVTKRQRQWITCWSPAPTPERYGSRPCAAVDGKALPRCTIFPSLIGGCSCEIESQSKDARHLIRS
jgi:hypothetical protein